MDPFKNFPDIELERLCKGWDNRTLLNMSEASSRVYQICFEERERRKKKFFEEKARKLEIDVKIAFDKLIAERQLQFKKEINDITIWLTFSTYGSHFYISQIVTPEEAAPSITWIINPDINPLIENRGAYANKHQTKDIIKEALKQEYILLDDVEYL